MPHVFKVALLIETSNRYGRDLLYGVRDWISEGETWSIRFTEQARRAPLPAWLAGWRGDGIIARVDSPEIAAVLRRTRLPVVDVSADRLRSPFPRVSIDNQAVARLAAQHLQSKGLRNFAFIGDSRFVWATERGSEFRRLAKAAGYSFAEYKGGRASSRDSDSDTEIDSILQWVRGLPKPVGIFACYDHRALQILEACQIGGIAVPNEVAVMGVDDDELLCQLSSPPLTSVLPNARLTGYEAAATLSRMMSGGMPGDRSRKIEPIRVVERQSTDAVAVEDRKIAAALRYIHEHATEGIDVSDVLRAVPISRTLFDRKFKALLGHSPHQQIVRKRVERARQLLVDSDLSITVIAELAGFVSASYLSTVFRRETGMSPYGYRTKLRRTRLSVHTAA